MCFKAPKPPKVVEDPNLKRQIEGASVIERERRSENKLARFEESMAMLSGNVGRRSLLTGSKGGMGFGRGAMRSLLG